MSEESKIRDAADAVKGIVEAVPIYQDALQPAAKEIGKGLETIAKTIHIALAPIAALVWGFEQIRDFVTTRVAEKLKDIPQERIQTPSPMVAGPALEALKYTGHEESLRELYANLLATSIDSETAASAHPAFVDMIKSMTPDEAKIMNLLATRRAYPIIDLKVTYKEGGGFLILHRNVSLISEEAGCQHPQFTANYLDNLCRLGLLEIPFGRFLKESTHYEPIENDPGVLQLKQQFEGDDKRAFGVDRRKVELTDLGKQFVGACVIDKSLMAKKT
jgi:Abortive infection alpha